MAERIICVALERTWDAGAVWARATESVFVIIRDFNDLLWSIAIAMNNKRIRTYQKELL